MECGHCQVAKDDMQVTGILGNEVSMACGSCKTIKGDISLALMFLFSFFCFVLFCF